MYYDYSYFSFYSSERGDGGDRGGWGQQNNRGQWRGMRRGRGGQRGGGQGGNYNMRGGHPQQGVHPQQQQHQQQQQQGNNPQNQRRNVLKFEGDYDFEQANTEFENLRSQLAKIKITATAVGTSNAGIKMATAADVTPDNREPFSVFSDQLNMIFFA